MRRPHRARPTTGSEAYASLYGEAASWTGRPVDPMLPFCIMFTSGTTSSPKAVVHTHANAIWASRTRPAQHRPDG